MSTATTTTTTSDDDEHMDYLSIIMCIVVVQVSSSTINTFRKLLKVSNVKWNLLSARKWLLYCF